MISCFTNTNENAIPITLVTRENFSTWISCQESFLQSWLQSTQFRAEAGSVSLISGNAGKLNRVICCVNELNSIWNIAGLPLNLPEGNYFLENLSDAQAIGWGLGAYQFTRYKSATRKPARLFIKENKKINSIVESIYFVRDLINTPTENMGPTELAEAATQLAKKYHATISHIVGDDLLKQNFAAIHAVGRASDDAPRLIDLRWGNKNNPKITLVGKGVCFDSGGLDIKNAAGMLLMKKRYGRCCTCFRFSENDHGCRITDLFTRTDSSS